MEENQVSNISLWAAYMRAYHSKHVTYKIFYDFLAYDSIPKDMREKIKRVHPETRFNFNY